MSESCSVILRYDATKSAARSCGVITTYAVLVTASVMIYSTTNLDDQLCLLHTLTDQFGVAVEDEKLSQENK